MLNRDNRVLQSSGNEKPPQFTLPPHSKPKEKPSGIVILFKLSLKITIFFFVVQKYNVKQSRAPKQNISSSFAPMPENLQPLIDRDADTNKRKNENKKS